jgi:ABC-2 type transport system permease protein
MSEFALLRKKSKSFRELNAILTIMARDILLTFKSPGSLVISFVLPVIMMGMLGGSLAQNIAGSFGFNYGSFMLVGMLVNMLFMITTMGLISLVEDRQISFTQEMMISPVSRYSIVIGKILGSTFAAVAGLAGTLIVGLVMRITIGWVQLLEVLALSPLICLSAGALSMIIIGSIKNTRTASIVASFMTFPQMFLSGVIIPINHSSGVLLVLSRIMPMTYCLDLTRAVVYAGTQEYHSVVLFHPLVSLLVVVALTVIFLSLGTYLFARSETHR